MNPIRLCLMCLCLCMGVLLPRAAGAQTCTGQNCGVTSTGQTCSCFDCFNRGPGTVPPVCATFAEPQMCPIRTQATPGGSPDLPVVAGVVAPCCIQPDTPTLAAACAAVGEQGDGLFGSPCGQVLHPTCNVVSGNGSVFPLFAECPAPSLAICYAGAGCNPSAVAGCKPPFVCSNVTWTATGAPQAGRCIAQGSTPVPIPKKADMGLFAILLVLGVGGSGAARRAIRR
jgi:hypothetical protein